MGKGGGGGVLWTFLGDVAALVIQCDWLATQTKKKRLNDNIIKTMT